MTQSALLFAEPPSCACVLYALLHDTLHGSSQGCLSACSIAVFETFVHACHAQEGFVTTATLQCLHSQTRQHASSSKAVWRRLAEWCCCVFVQVALKLPKAPPCHQEVLILQVRNRSQLLVAVTCLLLGRLLQNARYHLAHAS